MSDDIKISLEIQDWELKKIIDNQIRGKVEEIVIPVITEKLKSIDTEEVAKIIEGRIKETIEYGLYNEDRINEGTILHIIEKKIQEIAEGISDDYLKNILLSRLMSKI